jgi:predicted RNA binding protein YcfA (HicA-like mRNA interferase family)
LNYSRNAWDQLKNKTADDIIAALLKDGFLLDSEVRTERIYRHENGRKVSIHYHTGSKGYGKSLLKALLDDIGWTEKDMIRLKLIKK